MMIMSLIIFASIPLMTGRKLAIGTDKLVQKCILEDAGSIASSNCVSAISNCKINNSNNSCNNLTYYADKGTITQKDSALKVIQEACNQGGILACNYLINICMTDNTMCNISSTTPPTGLRPFLLKDNLDNTIGKLFIEKNLKSYYTDKVMNIMNEVDADCCAGGVANAACNIKNVTSCPPDPACGATIIGSIKVSNCNNVTANAAANNVDPGGSIKCWRGLNTSCSGGGAYPGCGRPVCNHAGAVEACRQLNGGVDYTSIGKHWRLPNNAELGNFYANNSSLNLCDDDVGYSPYCDGYSGCTGSNLTSCAPAIVWSADPVLTFFYMYNLTAGSWLGPYTSGIGFAYSTRCVRNL